jgi:phospholipid/cholesterol/gamma-HCH transport system substrate-binding protein
MPKPLKVRRVNEIVGLFVLVALVLAVAAVVLGPRTQRWFTPATTLTIHLPPEGSLGLRKGGDVQILGSVVGSVEDISVSKAGEMEAQVSIRGNFIRFVRQDSVAIIRKPLGIGDASIEITRGYGAPLPARGAFLRSEADKAPTQLIEETLVAIREEALPALKELRGAISEYVLLASELRERQGELQVALQQLNRLGNALEKGEGVAGMLLFDPGPAAELRAALPKVNASLAELQATLADARKLAARLPRIGEDMEDGMKDLRATAADARRIASAVPELEKSVKRTVDAAPAVLLQAQSTLHEIQRLTEALQRNWLVRGGMAPADSGVRLSGDRVGTDR